MKMSLNEKEKLERTLDEFIETLNDIYELGLSYHLVDETRIVRVTNQDKVIDISYEVVLSWTQYQGAIQQAARAVKKYFEGENTFTSTTLIIESEF